MARARNIKPGLFKNELLGVADPLLTPLFVGLWCLADREGRLEDRPMRIKAELFPYREGLDVNGYLTELERLGFICRYTVGGEALIQVLNFLKHQNPHKTEKKSDLPEMPLKSVGCRLTVIAPVNNGSRPADSLIPDSLIPDPLDKTAAPSAPRKSSPITLASYLAVCKQAEKKPISESDPVFTYADSIGLSREFLLLHWDQFKDRYLENGKRYKDWPMSFRNSVKGNWFKLWFMSQDGGYALTTVGQQAKRANGVHS